jgi:AraC-like DNA-binding protein
MTFVNSHTVAKDPDEAESLVATAYFPHELLVLGKHQDFELRLRASNLGPVTVGLLRWGTDVGVNCSYPDSYAINIPLSGRLESTHGGRRIQSVSGLATVCEPDRPASVTLWSADCVGVGLKIDRDYLVRKFSQLDGRESEVLLPDQIDLSSPHWRGWVNLLRALPHQSGEGNDLLGGPEIAKQLSSAIVDSLLMGLTASGWNEGSRGAARPRQITRVLDALHADPSHAWTLGEMAAMAGVSGRRLQQSFRICIGSTPTEYLRDLRLTLVHRDLLAGSEGTLVQEIAAKWGFVHMGRFALAFKQKYGHAPSGVLRGP